MKLSISQATAVMGLDPYTSKSDVMRAVIRQANGAESEFKENPASQWQEDNLRHALDKMEAVLMEQINPVLPLEDDLCYGQAHGMTNEGDLVYIYAPYAARKEDYRAFTDIDEKHKTRAQLLLRLYDADYCHVLQWSPHQYFYEVVPQANVDVSLLQDFILEVESEDPAPHLAPLRVDAHHLRELVAEIKEYDIQMSILKDLRQEKFDELVEKANGEDLQIGKFKLTQVNRKGAVDWKKVIQDNGIEVNEDDYRRAGSSSWRLS